MSRSVDADDAQMMAAVAAGAVRPKINTKINLRILVYLLIYDSG